jgi:hypothetical protein
MLWLLLACTPTDPAPASTEASSLDDTLTIAHGQVVGTHNSYHVDTTGYPPWAYTHRPLDEQLDLGVRQFELDVWDLDGEVQVLHLPGLDAGVTCGTLADCAGVQAAWSDQHPDHFPLVTLVETKSPEARAAFLDAVDDVLRGVWGDRLFTPADLLGEAVDLPSALGDEGWPTLSEMRGTALYVLHDGGDHRHVYLQTDLAERAMFPDGFGDLTVPWAAVHSINDPDDPRIADVVAAGHLVRTRADSDLAEAEAGDTTRRDAALASGAHFLSTDFPEPHPDSGYVVALPDPVGCNPLTAPTECAPGAMEP